MTHNGHEGHKTKANGVYEMKAVIAPVKNVLTAQDAFDNLCTRGIGVTMAQVALVKQLQPLICLTK